MNKQILRAIPLALAVGLMAGCATSGTGMGNLRGGGDMSANFTWASTGDRTGTMTASLSTGKTFSGQFFQITSETQMDSIRPLWYGWSRGWRGWGYWGPEPDMAFITHYSGRVVANLADANGEHARCHFQLIHPREGMVGGGEGECQLPNGQTIDATFPRA